MKRIAPLTLVAMLALASCNTGNTDAPTTTSATTNAPATTSTATESTITSYTDNHDDADHHEDGDHHEDSDHHDDADHADDADHDETAATSDLAVPDGATEVAELEARLFVTDDAGSVDVISLATGEIGHQLDLDGITRLAADGRYVFAAQRDDNRLQIIDGGSYAIPHGDHDHYYAAEPTVIAADIAAASPTHVTFDDELTAVFNDGDGTAMIFDTASLTASTAEPVVTIETGVAHHGVAIAFAEQQLVLASTAVEGDALPNGVALYDLATGEELDRVENCPMLHGQIRLDETILLGCDDGVLVLKPHHDHLDALKVDYPAGVAADTRTGRFVAGPEDGLAIGNLSDTQLVLIDANAGTARLVDVPGTYTSFAAVDDAVLALTTDGSVHRIEPLTNTVLDSLPVIEAYETANDHGATPSPTLLEGDGRTYLSSPATNQIIELATDGELRVARTFDLDAVPASMALIGSDDDHASDDHGSDDHGSDDHSSDDH